MCTSPLSLPFLSATPTFKFGKASSKVSTLRKDSSPMPRRPSSSPISVKYGVNTRDGSSAYLALSLSMVRASVHETALLGDSRLLSYTAVKCNPDPYVLRLLAALGTGFDCASHGEISQVLGVGGIDPSRIIFANPCKATSFIRQAAKMGVDMMTFDNADELYKIARVHPRAKLVIRILTDDSKSLCRLGLKFGAPLVAVPDLLAKAKELGLDVIGVSFHVGSGCYDPNAFSDAVMRARSAFDMGAEVGYKFNFLDVGGGFEDADFEDKAKVLSGAIERYFPSREGLRIIAEPGRFYVSAAFTLVANIIARRARGSSSDVITESSDSSQPSVMYYINDGVYGSFNCIMFDHQEVQPFVLTMGKSFDLERFAGTPVVPSSIWGPTCDSIDCVCPLTSLPPALEVGDYLGFRGMGAYTTCAASQFNGFQRSLVRYTSGIGPDSRAVRRALQLFAA
ncbi:hypothetical protein BOTBODRAFT_434275 [Botryobasidium botryosum FD-172 SS1]|uniref:Orn/DAP/Arg decarboxylase 2 N-terminal domain-containing protein n=1 Tax=Botryobasidium botryosum (strain FD-172 SS1) TaxID=930990 RepID=A0A067MU69_BOTB1|nr:hypothetical protein BOTBODRAFT_434275 [Botryobasidium botryosum FD-172 SS1]